MNNTIHVYHCLLSNFDYESGKHYRANYTLLNCYRIKKERLD